MSTPLSHDRAWRKFSAASVYEGGFSGTLCAVTFIAKICGPGSEAHPAARLPGGRDAGSRPPALAAVELAGSGRDSSQERPAEGDGLRERQAADRPREVGGRKGPDPTRYGDWELRGRCIDF